MLTRTYTTDRDRTYGVVIRPHPGHTHAGLVRGTVRTPRGSCVDHFSFSGLDGITAPFGAWPSRLTLTLEAEHDPDYAVQWT